MTRPCALYLLYAGAELVYVGIAYNPDQRIRAHRRRLTWSRVVVRWYPDRPTAAFIERLAIRVHQPPGNVKDNPAAAAASAATATASARYGIVRGMFAITPVWFAAELYGRVPPAVYA